MRLFTVRKSDSLSPWGTVTFVRFHLRMTIICQWEAGEVVVHHQRNSLPLTLSLSLSLHLSLSRGRSPFLSMPWNKAVGFHWLTLILPQWVFNLSLPHPSSFPSFLVLSLSLFSLSIHPSPCHETKPGDISGSSLVLQQSVMSLFLLFFLSISLFLSLPIYISLSLSLDLPINQSLSL